MVEKSGVVQMLYYISNMHSACYVSYYLFCSFKSPRIERNTINSFCSLDCVKKRGRSVKAQRQNGIFGHYGNYPLKYVVASCKCLPHDHPTGSLTLCNLKPFLAVEDCAQSSLCLQHAAITSGTSHVWAISLYVSLDNNPFHIMSNSLLTQEKSGRLLPIDYDCTPFCHHQSSSWWHCSFPSRQFEY